jgi:hypothetical protein
LASGQAYREPSSVCIYRRLSCVRRRRGARSNAVSQRRAPTKRTVARLARRGRQLGPERLQPLDWLTFKQSLQVYDGVVLPLCNNDADFFGRSYHIRYPRPQQAIWECNHPCGAAVARCFDDIALFSPQTSLPIAVCYFNAWDRPDQLRICEIIGDLCAARSLPFIDTFSHYRSPNFVRADLVVGSADFHPSAMALDAIGRHLAATLRQHGWFREYDTPTIDKAADRILTSARTMVEADHYPPDAALNWALRALDAKSRVARRMQAMGAVDNFNVSSARVADVLAIANRRWHVVNRTKAYMAEVAAGGHSITSGLWRAEEERFRLEELDFALGTGDWNRLTARLTEVEPSQCTSDTRLPDVPDFLDGCSLDIQHFRDATDGLRRPAARAAIGGPHDEASLLADLDALSRLADRAQAECAALKATLLRIERSFANARAAPSDADSAHVSSLVGVAFEHAKEALGFVRSWPAAIERICDPNYAAFTTVEVTICGEPIEGRPLCNLGGQVNYSVPNRLPFSDAGGFWPDGSNMLVTLRFPLFYVGCLVLRPWIPTIATRPVTKASLIRVEVYNSPGQRRVIEPQSFHKDPAGRFVSPILYLP